MSSYTQHVDPFIGVDGAGNTLCGPYLPQSIVRLGPDTLFPQKTNGYATKDPIVCFSHTHVSGTGGGARYGNVGVIPLVGPQRIISDCFDKSEERAEPGYYSVVLLPSGVRAELTSTMRTGVHRYTFPEGADAGIVIDAGAVVQRGFKSPGNDKGMCIGGFVEAISDREIVGRGDFKGGWGHSFPYSVFFYARFDRPAARIVIGTSLGFMPATVADGANCRASASFGNARQVNLVVGISFVSVAKARASADREVGGSDFDTVRNSARAIWESSLSRIRVQGGTGDQRTLFYTLFTRLVGMPSDLGIDDENPLWESGVRHFWDYYCLWDSVRNANSFISLFDPKLEIDMLNCLLDVADHTGWLPDAWIAGHSAMIQGGSSADVLLCEAALKGFEGIDYRHALAQMRKNNEVESPDPWLYGRHLPDYRDIGYLSTNVRKNCVSRHMEYAYQDWCIGKLAERLGENDVAARYREGSKKLWNLWRDDIKSFAPRHPDGQWVNPFNPLKALSDSWNDPYFYEGTSCQWSFNTQHDFSGLIDRHGGKEAFVRHLDWFFDSGHYGSKETMLHIPYLYILAGRPDKTARRVSDCMERYFRVARNGLADNEDMGCQSAFYMCSAIGLYPMMGQDWYFVTPPVFERIEIDLPQSGATLTIEARGAGEDVPMRGVLNGRPLDAGTVGHRELLAGGTLAFERR